MKLICETKHIIIRYARKSNKLLSDELKYYLQQILESVRNSLQTPFLPSQGRKNKKSKKNKIILVSPTLTNNDSKKSEREEISYVLDNESEAMHSALSSSEGESETEINANDAPPLPASIQSDDKHESG
ncbi:hypothetical protein NPIL_493291 [Nephila pilipes]|uniref:Uncharacterized protein n=1 Tax=Nephila pilipes TaxID=299642 RepID=A0A8X6US37_NEPPI|nr:hypothetical protein NPIL_493291 [Nephila pilipes]